MVHRQLHRESGVSGFVDYRQHTLLLDPMLRVLTAPPFDDSPETHVARLLKILDAMPRIAQPALAMSSAPVLVVPRVFEPAFCRALIAEYESHGGRESGFMREQDGRTAEITDYKNKSRRDHEITDQRLRQACMARIHDQLVPLIQRAFQFRATRIERYLVAYYDATQGGHFRAHRDNTTKGTAHRRLAVSLHLNTGEYEGGYEWAVWPWARYSAMLTMSVSPAYMPRIPAWWVLRAGIPIRAAARAKRIDRQLHRESASDAAKCEKVEARSRATQ